MPTLHGADIHEGILYGLAKVNGTLDAGVAGHARDKILATLREAGFAVNGFEPRTEEELAHMPPHWLVVLGANMEDGFSFLVVPDEELDPELREALRACDGVTFSGDTLQENPRRWRDCLLVMLAAGVRDPDSFAWDIEHAPAGLVPPRERLDALTGSLSEHWMDCEDGVLDAARLNRRIARVSYIFDWL